MTSQRQLYQSCNNIDGPPPPYGKYYVYNTGPVLTSADKAKRAKALLSNTNGRVHRRNSGNGPCHNSHATNIRTRGAHEFYNMMWDPTIYRGNSYKTYQMAELARATKFKSSDLAKKRRFPKHPKKIGGIVRPTVQVEQVTLGFGDMGIQTEPFLEELTSDAAKREISTQIEGEISDQKYKDILFKPFSIGDSKDCQTDGAMTYPFDENVKIIQTQLSKKILEQSILETVEDAEVETLRQERQGFMQKRREESFRLHRLIEAKRAVADTRSGIMAVQQKLEKLEQEAEEKLGALLYSSGCIARLVPASFNAMKQEGFISGTRSKDIQDSWIPALNNGVTEYCRTKNASHKILDVMLSEVVSKREKETADYKPPPTIITSHRRSNSISINGSFDGGSYYSEFGEDQSNLSYPSNMTDFSRAGAKSSFKIHSSSFGSSFRQHDA